MRKGRVVLGALVAALAVVAAGGCGGRFHVLRGRLRRHCTPGDSPVVTLAAYSNPYDAYGKMTSNFASRMEGLARRPAGDLPAVVRGEHDPGENIVNGFPADIYASSTGPDVQIVQDSGAHHP